MLEKQNRLKKDKDFKAVFKKGFSYKNSCLVLKVAENTLDYSRFGFVASLKVSKKAVVRNKIRRRLSEIIRAKLDNVKPGFDFIFICLPNLKNKNFFETSENMKDVLTKAKAFK